MNNKTVKKWWLASLFAEPIYQLGAIIFLISLISDASNANKFLSDKLLHSIAEIIIGLFISIVGSILLFFCAYRKAGTRLLTFCLFCTGLTILYSIFSLGASTTAIYMLHKLNAPWENIFLLAKVLLMGAIGLIVSIFWLFFSFKLRQLNKKIQLDHILAIGAYQALFQRIEAATTSEELHGRYGESVRNNPEIAWHLKKAFKQRNVHLSSQ